VGDPKVFGQTLPGSPDDPGVYMESVHYLMKTVAGVPNLRPAWYFDVAQQGEGLNDVGVHLVDLVNWTLFPGQGVDHTKDIQISSGQAWPTVLTLANFQRVTGEPDFPEYLRPSVKDGTLQYVCNTLVGYTVRGIHVKLNVIWDWEAPPGGGDTHFAFFRGTKARIEIRQGKAEKGRPELYVVPSDPAQLKEIETAVSQRLAALGKDYPELGLKQQNGELKVLIPDRFRTTHEQHFGEVAHRFLGFLERPNSMPDWEKPNMLAKYWVTTQGVDLARRSPPKAAKRLAPQ
jgi:predicted dehydrogenase